MCLAEKKSGTHPPHRLAGVVCGSTNVCREVNEQCVGWDAGDKAFEFTAALHSYFEVKDISVAKVEGLKGLDFLDKVNFGASASSWKEVQ